MQLEYKVSYGQTIYDLTILLYGDYLYLYKLISENPIITNINFDFNTNPGLIIYYDPTIKLATPVELIKKSAPVISPLQTLIAQEGQTLYDICLMTYGTFDLMYKLLQDNNMVSLNNSDIKGKNFIFDKTLIKDNLYYKNLQSTGYKIATGFSKQELFGRSFNISWDFSFH